MKPDRWVQIDRLLGEALDREPEHRKAFLEEACPEDADIRREVEALLDAHEKAGSFVQTPVLDLSAPTISCQEDHSLSGRKLGPYEILSLIGRGGMGEVYKALDTRLGRVDALKILPVKLAADPGRLRRFVREAKAASLLNHPNIATIYEIGESDGIHWIAMELVEGQTLAERIKERPLEVEEVLDVSIQAAEGLEAAHKKGIIHRDIKPANLMLTPEGRVKILDFGLAKIARPEGKAAATTVSESHDFPGIIIGTARYMSPEQVLGHAVDHRT
ncbi:MAG TPA: serine/threonine-protein kinase, partial [Acidobacteriota bacterium]|nr:serine/threonine-protein kinase [Acidobacteriota bacterium]